MQVGSREAMECDASSCCLFGVGSPRRTCYGNVQCTILTALGNLISCVLRPSRMTPIICSESANFSDDLTGWVGGMSLVLGASKTNCMRTRKSMCNLQLPEWPLRLWRFVSSLTSKLPYRCVPGLFTDCNVKNGLRRDGEGFLLLLEALAIGPRTAEPENSNWESFRECLEEQHICSVNSFRPPGHTFFGNLAGVRSRIDHVC